MTHAVVLIEAERDALSTLGGALADIEGVAEAYSVTGEWDFVAIVRVPDHEQLAEVVTERDRRLSGVARTQTMVAFAAFSGTTSRRCSRSASSGLRVARRCRVEASQYGPTLGRMLDAALAPRSPRWPRRRRSRCSSACWRWSGRLLAAGAASSTRRYSRGGAGAVPASATGACTAPTPDPGGYVEVRAACDGRAGGLLRGRPAAAAALPGRA